MGRTIDLHKRKDGRYKAVYHGKQFYGKTPKEARAKRDMYKKLIEDGMQVEQVTVAEYALNWLPRAKVDIKPHTYNGYAKILDDMNEIIGHLPLNKVKPYISLFPFQKKEV